MNKRRIDIAKKKKTGKWLKLIIKVFTLVILLTLAIGIFYFYNTYGKILIKLQKRQNCWFILQLKRSLNLPRPA